MSERYTYDLSDHARLLPAGDNQYLFLLNGHVIERAFSSTDLRALLAFLYSEANVRGTSSSEYSALPDPLNTLFIAGIVQRSTVPSVQVNASVLCVPTRNRPGMISRLLAQLAQDAELAGQVSRVLVLDDSTTDAAVQGNIKAMTTFHARTGIGITRAGRETKHRLCEVVAGNLGGHLGTLTALLMGGPADGETTVGANRNVGLLMTQGERVISLDDDVLPLGVDMTTTRRVQYAQDDSDRVRVISAEERAALDAQANISVAKTLNRALGLDVKAFLRVNAQKNQEFSVPRHLHHPVMPGAHVALTLTGSYGDSAWDDRHLPYFHPGYLERLNDAGSQKEFAALQSGRLIARASRQPTLSPPSVPFQSMAMGIDNTRFTPPFPPQGRAEDVAFGTILSVCTPEALALRLPVALAHAPEGLRQYRSEVEITATAGLWLAKIARDLPALPHASAPERLTRLRVSLAATAGLPHADFHAWTTQIITERLLATRQHVGALLLTGRLSALVSLELRQMMDLSHIYTAVRAFTPGRSQVLQRQLSSYGLLLELWQAMCECQDLRVLSHEERPG